LYVALGYAASGILHFHGDRIFIFTRCTDQYFALTPAMLQGIETIADKVQQDLLQLYSVAAHTRKIASKLDF